MSLLGSANDFRLRCQILLSNEERTTDNVGSLPEQFEMLHDWIISLEPHYIIWSRLTLLGPVLGVQYAQLCEHSLIVSLEPTRGV